MKKKPQKSLTRALKRKSGRNNSGRITIRHRGGGAKRRYRIIEFGQKKIDQKAKVLSIEYDPNRTCDIALLEYQDGTRQYILAPQNLKQEVEIREKTDLEPGNRMKLKNIPVGTTIYNIELIPGQGGKMARSAGSSCQVMAHEGKYTLLKLPSTEMRNVQTECFCSVGALSNPEHRFKKLTKAGQTRHRGRRPQVRGSAMNPVDHPHGGGEGRASIGLKYPKTPWGKHALGVKTRKKKQSDKLIVQRRKNK